MMGPDKKNGDIIPDDECKERIITRFDGRFSYFRTKHKQSKADLKIMEKHAFKVMNYVEDILEGNTECIDDAFKHYKLAVRSYKEALRNVRITLLTERKFASEIWGPNNISIYDEDTGKHIILDNVIEDLLKADYLPAYAEPKPDKRKEKKEKVEISMPKKEVVIKDDPIFDGEFRWSDWLCDEDMAITRSKTRAKQPLPTVIPEPVKPILKVNKRKKSNQQDNKNNGPNTKKTKRISNSPIISEERVKQPSPRPKAKSKTTTDKSSSESKSKTPEVIEVKPKVVIPKVKPTPMPKFQEIEDCIISRRVEEIIKDNKAFMCTCKPNKNGFGCFSNCINVHLHMECGSRCFLGDKCKNKRFQNKEYAAFEPFFAGAKGWGIRAKELIKKGDFIVEYMGEVVDGNETERRLKRYAKNGHRHHYMMGLRNGAVIDATKYGNFSRFVNHSCDPNAETQKWIADKKLRIGFFAKKDIQVGDEIVFDYAFERFGKKAQVCYCGAENCTGFIGGKPEEDDEDDENTEEDSEGSEIEDLGESLKIQNNKLNESDKPMIVRQPRRKKTKEEIAEMKLITKTKKRIGRAKQEIRQAIGLKKKNFNKEEILAIIRFMVVAKRYEERLLISDILCSITDEQVKDWYVEQGGLLALFQWMTDLKYTFKQFVRLLSQCYKFMSSLPIKDYKYITEAGFLSLARHHSKTIVMTEERIVEDCLTCMINDVMTKVEPNIDKDVLRVLDREPTSISVLCDSIVNNSTLLVQKWEEMERGLSENVISEVMVDEDAIECEHEPLFDENDSIYPAIPTDRRLTPPTPSDETDDHTRSISRTSYATDTSSYSSKRSYSRSSSRRSYSRDRSLSRSRSPRRYSYRSSKYERRRYRSRSRSRSYSPRNRYYDRDRRYNDRYDDRDSRRYRNRRYDRDYRDFDRKTYNDRWNKYEERRLRAMSPIRKPAVATIKIEPENQLKNFAPVPPPQLLTKIPKPVAKDVAEAFPDSVPMFKTFISIKTNSEKKEKPPIIPVPIPVCTIPFSDNSYQPKYGYPVNPFFVPPPPPDYSTVMASDAHQISVTNVKPVPEPIKIEISKMTFDDVATTTDVSEGENVTASASSTGSQEPAQESAKPETQYEPHPKNPNWLMIPQDGYYYYFNKETNETTWDEPPDLEVELAKKKASTILIKEEIMDTSFGNSSSISESSNGNYSGLIVKKEVLDVFERNGSYIHNGHDFRTNGYNSRESSRSYSRDSNGYNSIDDQTNIHTPTHLQTQIFTEEMRAKKEYKAKVFTHILKYVRNWSKARYYAEESVSQFCRKMTHLTLNSSVTSSDYAVTEAVYAQGRKLVDKNLAEFVKHNKPIIPFEISSSQSQKIIH